MKNANKEIIKKISNSLATQVFIEEKGIYLEYEDIILDSLMGNEEVTMEDNLKNHAGFGMAEILTVVNVISIIISASLNYKLIRLSIEEKKLLIEEIRLKLIERNISEEKIELTEKIISQEVNILKND